MAMQNPSRPGRGIQQNCLALLRLNITAMARVLSVARHILSRLLNGHADFPGDGVRLKKAGWPNAESCLRRQATLDLAQVRRNEDRIKVERYRPQPASWHDAAQMRWQPCVRQPWTAGAANT